MAILVTKGQYQYTNLTDNVINKEGLVPLKRLIPLQMFAPVLSQESNVQ